MGEYFTSKVLQAFLLGSWVDLSTDWLSQEKTSAKWGIDGIEPLDIMPGIGEMTFILLNIDGKYYLDGPSPLAGWKKGVPIRVVFTYASTSYVRFRGYLEKTTLQVGDTVEHDRVSVTALDWIKFAEKHPLLTLDIEENKRADEGILTILDTMPNPPINVVLQTGVNTFPVIFNRVGLRTTAYEELSELTYSEFGAMALLKDATDGETLKAFNYNDNLAGSVMAYFETDIDDVKLNDNDIVNRGIATAHPTKIDKELRVLYSLDKAMPIKAGETITFRAKYTDPEGGGQANAIVESMQTPEVPGAVDPYRMTLLNFTTAFEDETGRHTWVPTDYPDSINIFNDVYHDGYGTQYVHGNKLGPYLVTGGYPPGKLTCATSADFEFGAPSAENAFTISFYLNTINPAPGNNVMARDSTLIPPFLIGYPQPGTKNLLAWFTSNGTSWDIGAAKSMGEVQVGRWTHYEISRDEDGWYYIFVDGNRTDKWYSPLAILASSGDFTIGNTQINKYCFMGFDSFFIDKGRCLHKTDFEPPRRNPKPTLDGDYLLNSLENGTGNDLSNALDITASYGSEAVTYTLELNEFATRGTSWITHLKARGRGVYSYNPIENSYTDSASAESDVGYKEINLDQKYQTNVKFGTQVVTKIVEQNKDPRTRLESLSFLANLNPTTMNNFLQRDIHDLIHAKDTARGVDNFFFIQKIKWSLRGEMVYVTYDLKSALDIDAAYPPPVPSTFGGVVNIQDMTITTEMETVTITGDANGEVTVTLDDMTVAPTMAFAGASDVVITPDNAPINALNWQNVFVFDEFASSSSGVYGQLGWSQSGAADVGVNALFSVSPSEHYGGLIVTNIGGTEAYVQINNLYSPMVKLVQFIAMFDATIDAGDGYIFGLVDTVTYETDGTALGIYFRREHGEGNWRTVTRNGSGITTNDTGVAFAADTWYLFEIKQDAIGTIGFYINGSLVETHSTNIDTATGLYPLFGMTDPGTDNVISFYFDYFAMQLSPITQRWD